MEKKKRNWSQRGKGFWSSSHTLVVTQLGLEPRSSDSQATALCTVCIWYKKMRKHSFSH